MIKDKYLRLIFIPFPGIVIPFFSGIISYNRSTGVGLRNLSVCYGMVCNKNILIETSDNEFTVKLPFIKSNL